MDQPELKSPTPDANAPSMAGFSIGVAIHAGSPPAVSIPAMPSTPPAPILANAFPPAPVEDTDPVPWFERYFPPKSESGAIAVSAREEWKQGLRPRDFSQRLRENGVAELALETLTALLGDPDVSGKVRVDAAKTILGYAHGVPATGDKATEVVVAIKLDI